MYANKKKPVNRPAKNKCAVMQGVVDPVKKEYASSKNVYISASLREEGGEILYR